ncbi:hypothetical protein [Pedobacter sp. ASV28]|uniref:hypothetical protein n=1 Tax=Pedobacter sp. ASV28 TaxID=2795123 RepID=UPI0018EB9702|nr:hypothetical protein [Pedobacter sp. ASV28]
MKAVSLLLLLTILTFKSHAAETDTLRKEINKNYSGLKNEILRVDNRFGNITLVQWDQKIIKVTVQLIASGKDKAAAERSMETIRITDSRTENTISLLTSLQASLKAGPSGQKQTNVSIHYLMWIPKGQSLALKNQFGNILLGDLSGRTELAIRYGNLTAGRFSGQVKISVQQGSANVKSISGGQFTARGFESVTIGSLSSDVSLDLHGGDKVNISLSPAVKSIGINAGHIGTMNIVQDKYIAAELRIKSIFSRLNTTDRIKLVSPAASDIAAPRTTADSIMSPRKKGRIPSAPQPLEEPVHQPVISKQKQEKTQPAVKPVERTKKLDLLSPKFYQTTMGAGNIPISISISYSTLNLTIP